MGKPQTLYLNEGLWITAQAPDRVPLGPVAGGGGGPGYGGWGLDAGRPRGTGRPSRFAREPGLRTVFGEEQNNVDEIHAELYAPALKQLPGQIEAERAAIAQQAADAATTPAQRLALQQQLTTTWLLERRAEYLQLLPLATSFYGAIPFYKRYDSFSTRLNDEGAFVPGTSAEAWTRTIWETYNASVDAAYRQHLAAEKSQALTNDLAGLAYQVDQTQTEQPTSDLSASIERRLAQIRTELQICFDCLPNFLQHQLVDTAHTDEKHTLSQVLLAHTQAGNALISAKQAAIPVYSKSNPQIRGPLSKPQLEALQHLVDEQLTKRAGPLWAEYPRALSLRESIRYLEWFGSVLNNLHERATLAEQQQASQQATTERNRIRYAADAASATTAPALIPIGTASFAIAQPAYTALQLSIRAAIPAIASSVSPLALLVGTVALLWPSSLGNSERQYLTSIPLADLSPPDGPDLTAMAASVEALDLPYLLAGAEENGSLDLYVMPGGKPVPVRAATFDSERQLYSLALENPQRILTWTPASAPGSDSSNATSLPAEQPGVVIFPGNSLTPIEVPQESYPALDLLDQNRLIVIFPIDSGLAPILVMFRDPRNTSGIRSGSGTPVTGLWLDDKVRQLGAPIPSQIAAQLSNIPVNDMKAFREDVWKLVAKDSALSTQFSESNVTRMKSGLAPKVAKNDRHKSHSTFIFHHHIPISEGGAVYDFDNIRIVTPKAHFAIHYGENHD